jgi:carboxyl-terminal processing protease
MLARTRIIIAVVLPMAVMLGFCNSINKAPKETLVDGVIGVMKYQHYQPLEINDSFSQRVYTLFLNQLDENKLFFHAKDLDRLSKYTYKIDDEVRARTYTSVDDIIATYMERIATAQTYSNEVFSNKIHLNQNRVFEIPDKNRKESKNTKELRQYWKDYNTFLVMENYVRKMINQEKSVRLEGDSFVPKPLDSLMNQAVLEVKKNQKEWFKRLLRLKDKDYFDMFVNCIAMSYDPHSSYFPPRQKEDFDIRLSGQFEGIGASLSERDGYIKVENIIPGSASYRQGELKSGDLITAVAQAEEEAVSVIDMPLSDVVQLIRGKKGTVVNLSVKKPDGSSTVIAIKRDVVVLEEGYAKSALIKDEVGNLGYINLPSFYADFNKKGGRSSAEDMAKEVAKLKKDDIKGLIIDLRYNGGGSLSDVVEMVGLFTGKGPAVQIKSKNNALDVYNSHTPKALYNGPLIILVNYYSASASEILAAALQDYKRAVVVGTKHTFGKGTVQRFMDLGSVFRSDDAEGSVKLTTQKFYRVNGKTTQFTGVIPDVIMPDRFDYTELGERQLPYALKEDKLKPAIPTMKYTQAYLKAISSAQTSVSSNAFLQKQSKIAFNINERNQKTAYQLDAETYKLYLTGLMGKQAQLDSIKPDYSMNLDILSKDRSVLASDSIQLKVRKEWVAKFSKDAYLWESVKIIRDLQ